MELIKEMLDSANKEIKTVNIKGKEYAQVNERIKAFRNVLPNWTIETEIIRIDEKDITTKTLIKDENGTIKATGLANENWNSSFINKTSALENCETSSIGRALGVLGIGVDGSMCSAEELVNALKQQKEREQIGKELDKISQVLTPTNDKEETKQGVEKAILNRAGQEEITDFQVTQLTVLIRQSGISNEQLLAYLKKEFNTDTLKNLTKKQNEKLTKKLQATIRLNGGAK